MAWRRWDELDPAIQQRIRRGILLGQVVDATLRIVALVDVARRPAAAVRGPKRRWVIALVAGNTFGVLPVVYLLRGRRS